MLPTRTCAAAVVTAMFAALTALTACGTTTATGPNPPAVPAASTPSGDGSTRGASDGPAPRETESNPPGDIPDSQVFVPFTTPGGEVTVKVPEGWARTTAGNATVFTDKLNRIEIALSTASTAPTVASVTSTDVPKLQATVPKFASGQVMADRRSAGPIVLVTYQGDSAQDPVTGKVVRDAFELYIYYQGVRRLDLTLSGPVNADNVDPWKIVSDSVRWH